MPYTFLSITVIYKYHISNFGTWGDTSSKIVGVWS